MRVHEQYKPITVGVNATVKFNGNMIGGFICKTDGNVTITAQPSGTVIVDAIPVTAGNVLPLPFLMPDGNQGGEVTTAGGASGILAV